MAKTVSLQSRPPRLSMRSDNSAGNPPGLRWPIHLQLLVPMVAVVLLASLLATAITVCWIAVRVRNEQTENLRRVAKTLGEAPYPPTGSVLLQVRGLSGAEFVLMGSDAVVQESTLALTPEWTATLTQIARPRPAGDGDRTESVVLGPHNYLVHRAGVARRSARASDSSTLLILYPEAQMARRRLRGGLSGGDRRRGRRGGRRGDCHMAGAAPARPLRTLAAGRPPSPMAILPRRCPCRRTTTSCAISADSINRMAEQLADYEEQVRRHERLRTLGQLGASMAHQLRNAAGGGRMAIELHRRECPRGESDESLDVALRNCG